MSLEKFKKCRCGSERLNFVGHHDGTQLVINEVYCPRCWAKIHPDPSRVSAKPKTTGIRIQREDEKDG